MTECKEPLYFRRWDGKRYDWIELKIAVIVGDTVVIYNRNEDFVTMTTVDGLKESPYFRNVLYEDNTIDFPLTRKRETDGPQEKD